MSQHQSSGVWEWEIWLTYRLTYVLCVQQTIAFVLSRDKSSNFLLRFTPVKDVLVASSELKTKQNKKIKSK